MNLISVKTGQNRDGLQSIDGADSSARFLNDVYRLTILASLGVALGLFLAFNLTTALSFSIGVFISLGAILSLEFIVRRTVKVNPSRRTKYLIGFIALGKYSLIFGGFYFLLKIDRLNVYALAGGIGMVQLSMVLRAILPEKSKL